MIRFGLHIKIRLPPVRRMTFSPFHFLQKMSTTQKDSKEVWLNWLAITTIIMSASATLGSSKSAGYTANAMMSQNKASDQWAFYQAKSIKQHSFELQKDILQVQLVQSAPAMAAKFQTKVAEYDATIERYTQERKEIKAEAIRFEAERDRSQKNGKLFGSAIIYLQIGITLSALAALLKKRPVWWLSLVVGLAGLLYFANGFIYTYKTATVLIPMP